MHDPMTQAFRIEIPMPWRVPGFLKNDPSMWATLHIATVWHVDPETDGSDDSCGWFKRARHGNPKVLERIIKEFEADWDRTWTYDPNEDCGSDEEEIKRGKTTYPCGWFNVGGMPRFSVMAITLNMMFIAANQHFKCDGRTNWKKSKRFLEEHLLDILLFSENTVDSLHDSLTLKFGKDQPRNERIRQFAEIVYGWVLRESQPWWKHPRWHVWHWRVQIELFQWIKRRRNKFDSDQIQKLA